MLTAFGPNGTAADFANPALIGSHVTVNQTQRNTDTLKQARFNATWHQDNLTIKAGGQYIEDRFQLSGALRRMQNLAMSQAYKPERVEQKPERASLFCRPGSNGSRGMPC